MKRRILVTGAGGPLGVNVTRSLKTDGEDLFLLGTDCNPYHLLLALTDEKALIPPAKSVAKYIESINELIGKWDIELIIPTHPVEVSTVSANREALSAKVFLPKHRTVLIGQDKFASYQIWAKKELPVPKTFFIKDRNDVERAFREISTTPVWVRGSGVPGAGIGVASLPCRTVDHALFWIDYWNGWGQFVASEYLPGKNLTWLSLWSDGKLVTSQGRERLEYVIPHVSPSGITGAPAVTKTVSREDLNAIGPKAILAIDENPHGAFFLDFKCDHAGTPKITEVNAGRFGTTVHFYTAAGVNFPRLLASLALGQDVPKLPHYNCLPAELYWIRTLDCGPVLIDGKALAELG